MRRTLGSLAIGALATAGVVLGSPTVAAAQEPGDATVVPLQVTGPPSQRLNLVILGDGYTADEIPQFRADVDRHLNVLWSIEPFRSYRHYFNIYAIEIVSADSGISCDPDDGNIERDTPLDMRFASTCPADPLARGISVSTAAVNFYASLVPGVSPQNRQTLSIANTFTYGGLGGTNATTSGSSPQGPLITPHELGHSLGQMADEYPYSSRTVVRDCYSGSEPGGSRGFHHTLYTDVDAMKADQHKWWRWLGEESEAGGAIGLYEGGNTFPCGVRRPSEHSIMRWIGFYFDQVGREHMTYRISGLRNAGQMPLTSTPLGEVGPDDIVWVETTHPKFHELDVTWSINGEAVTGTHNSRDLDLSQLGVTTGEVVSVTVRDPTEFVRDPFWQNGPRLTQTRQWIVGQPLPEVATEVEFTAWTPNERPVAGDEVVYVETTHPTDRILDVTWYLDGQEIPSPHNGRNLDLAALHLAPGTYQLGATVTDPAGSDGGSQTITWIIDNVLPTAPRTLSKPLTTLDGDVEHLVYFDGWDMRLHPQDDRTGYDDEAFVVGELRLNEDGWFNYFGFPEERDAPFKFRHSGTDVKALTYGNLGTGGLSKATFEQYFVDHPSGTFVPGYGTHKVEHRAIDPAGNIGNPEEYRATVLPGELPACTETLSGDRTGNVVITSGVMCLQAAKVDGGVIVRPGASLVAFDTWINGSLYADGAGVVQLFGTTVDGVTRITESATGITIAGGTLNGLVTLLDNDQVPHHEWAQRFAEHGFAYGPVLAGNTINGGLACAGNSAPARDFAAQNQIAGSKTGDCAGL